jgi:SIR2-like domain
VRRRGSFSRDAGDPNSDSPSLEESADVAKKASPARREPCEYHRSLVDALQPKDTIISFNYDCVIDHALRTSGASKWSARHGYGFPHPSKVDGAPAWDPPTPATAQSRSINLLKLHGSLNWFPFPDDETGTISLRERPYKQKGQKRYEIVPPEYVKTVGERPIFATLWSRAEVALRKAKTMAFVGFSFTPTDLHVEALFRLAVAKSSLQHVLIVERASSRRLRFACSSATLNAAVDLGRAPTVVSIASS